MGGGVGRRGAHGIETWSAFSGPTMAAARATGSLDAAAAAAADGAELEGPPGGCAAAPPRLRHP